MILGALDKVRPPHTLGNPGTSVVAYTDLANLFALAQTISLATAGSNLILKSQDAGTIGPDLEFYHESATPAAADRTGRVLFYGRDSGANKTLYGAVFGFINDTTNLSEDGGVALSSIIAGVDTTELQAANGLIVGAATGGVPGAGKINATAYKVNGVAAGALPIARSYDQLIGPQADVNDVIPADGSAPLVTEGTQAFSVAKTPASATSRIEIKGLLQWSSAGGAGADVAFALFKDNTCIAVFGGEMTSNGVMQTKIEWEEVSGSITARTYSLRYGPATAVNMRLNESGAGDDYGDKLVSNFIILEYMA